MNFPSNLNYNADIVSETGLSKPKSLMCENKISHISLNKLGSNTRLESDRFPWVRHNKDHDCWWPGDASRPGHQQAWYVCWHRQVALFSVIWSRHGYWLCRWLSGKLWYLQHNCVKRYRSPPLRQRCGDTEKLYYFSTQWVSNADLCRLLVQILSKLLTGQQVTIFCHKVQTKPPCTSNLIRSQMRTPGAGISGMDK